MADNWYYRRRRSRPTMLQTALVLFGVVTAGLSLVALVALSERSGSPPARSRYISLGHPSPAVPSIAAPPAPAIVPLPPGMGLRGRVLRALKGARASRLAAAVDVEGLGRIVDVGAGEPVLPASTLKLYTGIAALERLGTGMRFETSILRSGPVSGRTLSGHLVLVGGGDPSLSQEHIKRLAVAVGRRGITRVTGSLFADESRYDRQRTAPGWDPLWVPRYVGPLSALAVDGNGYRQDPTYVANPAAGNLNLFRAHLSRAGTKIVGPNMMGRPPGGLSPVARKVSKTLAELMPEVLAISDNFYSEMFVKELGRTRRAPSTAGGLRVIGEVAEDLGVRPPVLATDGSGLSIRDRDTLNHQIALIKAIASTRHWPVVKAALARACTKDVGYFGTRLCGTPAAGKVFAKTGVHDKMRALTGYTITSSGRDVFFAFNLGGIDAPPPAWDAMDKALLALTAFRG